MLPGVRGVINPVVLDPQHPRAVGGGRRGDGEQGAEHGDRDARRAGGHGWVLRATARSIREASTVPATPARGGRAHRHTGSRPWGRATCHLAPAERTRGTPRGFSRSLSSNTPAQPSPAPLTRHESTSAGGCGGGWLTAPYPQSRGGVLCDCQPCRRIWMPGLAKYPSIPKRSKSHTTQTMFANRTRPRQSDGIAGASFVPGRPSPLVHSVAVSVKLLATG